LRTPLYIVVFVLLYFKAEAQSSALKIADSLYTTGNYIAAINYYSKDDSYKSMLQIARAYNKIGNYDKSIVEYKNIIIKDTTLEIAKYELGKIYFKLKRFTKAEELFIHITKNNNKNPEYYYYLGQVQYKLDKKEEGIISYKKAIEIDSTHLRSIFRLGKHYVIEKETNLSLKYINMGLQFYENDVSLINLKALALFNNEEHEKAIVQFEKLIALGEEKPHIYNKLGYSYKTLWEFKKAKENYNALLAYESSISEAYNGLAGVYFKEKKRDSAIVYYKKAIEAKKPFLFSEYMGIASAYRIKKNLKLALKYYNLAHKEDTSDQVVYYQYCVIADQYFKDPKVKLENYQNFKEKFGTKKSYFLHFVDKRISELKEEIHLNTK